MNKPLLLNERNSIRCFFAVMAFFSFYFLSLNIVFGDNDAVNSIEGVSVIDKLKTEITARNDEIIKLQQEIDALDKNIKKSEGQSKTLKNELATISNTILQLNKKATVTETKIKSTELNIKRLTLEISNKEKDINFDKNAVGDMIKLINENDIKSSVEVVLSDINFSEGWKEVDSLEQVQKNVVVRIKDLEQKKNDLLADKYELDQERKELVILKAKLIDQKNIANQNKKSKDKLLSQTKNQETEYKKILADRKNKMNSLSRELFDYEAQLKIAIDPNSYPKSGVRVLGWPVMSPYITQKFGKTSDSGRLYASGTHNGMDFRASQGSLLLASAGGIIVGIGDTDLSCPDVSYGKWVLIKHSNGLATLYAHLSLIKVTQGQEVMAGEVIGYSGDTGYSEGPHLHFTVFVGNAVRIAGPTEYKSKICGTYLRMPLAPVNAYLDPGSYLPLSGSNVKFD